MAPPLLDAISAKHGHELHRFPAVNAKPDPSVDINAPIQITELDKETADAADLSEALNECNTAQVQQNRVQKSIVSQGPGVDKVVNLWENLNDFQSQNDDEIFDLSKRARDAATPPAFQYRPGRTIKRGYPQFGSQAVISGLGKHTGNPIPSGQN